MQCLVIRFWVGKAVAVSETHATADVCTACRLSDKADAYSFKVVPLELTLQKPSLDVCHIRGKTYGECRNGLYTKEGNIKSSRGDERNNEAGKIPVR